MAVTTLGQAIDTLEEHLFVGRERELAAFRAWITQASPATEILAVSGPGGVGKTALLSAFRRQARAANRQIIDIDGQHVRLTTTRLLAAFGGGSVDAVVRRLCQDEAVVLFDSFDRVGRLGPFLRDRLFARVDGRVRIVIASRQPLIRLWQRHDVWHKLVHVMALDALSRSESQLYLERRGLGDRPALLAQILQATHGHPLAMSLAADMATRLQIASLEAAPEWHLVVRGLVERLRETEDSSVRELLECAALVHDFDEATLLALAGCALDPAAFSRLCGLSIVRPTAHGLTLHEEVRHLLAEDLRWRNKARFNQLRERALAYCRAHTRATDPVERARALTNRLYLSEHDAVRKALFGDGSAGTVTVHAVRPWQHAEIRKAWNDDTVAGLLSNPKTQLRVARDRQQQIHGLAGVLPVSSELSPMSQTDAAMKGVVGTYLTNRSSTPADGPDTTQMFWHVHLIRNRGTGIASSTLAALLRESVQTFAEGGVHLTQASGTDHQAALEALGFKLLTPAGGVPASAEAAPVGYVLDLRDNGVECWADAVTVGRSPVALEPRLVEDELHGILAHWCDDVWLGRTTIFAFDGANGGEKRVDASRMRELVRTALVRLIDDGDVDERLAGQAVQLAYLTPRVSHVAAMERLAVSRATFYRLLRRGVRALARRLTTAETS